MNFKIGDTVICRDVFDANDIWVATLVTVPTNGGLANVKIKKRIKGSFDPRPDAIYIAGHISKIGYKAKLKELLK